MSNRLKRIATHAYYAFWDGVRLFPPITLSNIESALKMGSTIHGAKFHFVVESALTGAPLFSGQSARDRALDIFAYLRLWDTEQRNGVLIYVLLADKAVEIVVDRGLQSITTAAEWSAICHAMENEFHLRHFENGAINGIHAVNNLLIHHFRRFAGMAS
jgi:uncharacterized membrane protein